ncbi:MAG: hypothetical protein R3D28_10275 [Geminicoccaceae bacterium]
MKLTLRPAGRSVRKLALVGRRQELARPDLVRGWRVGHVEGRGQLPDRVGEPVGVDVAEAVLARVGRGDIDVDRHAEPAHLERLVDQRIELGHHVDRRFGVRDDELHGPGNRPHEALDGLRVGLDELPGRDHRVAVEVHAEVLVEHVGDVLLGHPLRHQVQHRREIVPGNDIDVPAHQHRLAQGRVHVDPRHGSLVDADLGGESRKELVGRIEDRRPQRVADEVLRLLDARGLERVEAEGGRIVDHHHGLDALPGVRRVELDQRVDVGEAHLVGARGDAGDGTGRAVAAVDRDGQPLLGEIPQVIGGDDRRCRPLVFPVQGELDVRLRERGAAQERRCQAG